MKKMSGQYTVTTNQPRLVCMYSTHIVYYTFGTCRLCSTWTVLCFLSHS